MIIHKAAAWTQEKLIKALNPVITGWANYHRHIVANMTLDGIECVISSKYYSGISWKSRNPKKVNFLRYANDFIVTADSEETAKEIMELIELFLKERGLELSEEKTLITHIDEGFDFFKMRGRK